jgi:hypothetical protein
MGDTSSVASGGSNSNCNSNCNSPGGKYRRPDLVLSSVAAGGVVTNNDMQLLVGRSKLLNRVHSFSRGDSIALSERGEGGMALGQGAEKEEEGAGGSLRPLSPHLPPPSPKTAAQRVSLFDRNFAHSRPEEAYIAGESGAEGVESMSLQHPQFSMPRSRNASFDAASTGGTSVGTGTGGSAGGAGAGAGSGQGVRSALERYLSHSTSTSKGKDTLRSEEGSIDQATAVPQVQVQVPPSLQQQSSMGELGSSLSQSQSPSLSQSLSPSLSQSRANSTGSVQPLSRSSSGPGPSSANINVSKKDSGAALVTPAMLEFLVHASVNKAVAEGLGKQAANSPRILMGWQVHVPHYENNATHGTCEESVHTKLHCRLYSPVCLSMTYLWALFFACTYVDEDAVSCCFQFWPLNVYILIFVLKFALLGIFVVSAVHRTVIGNYDYRLTNLQDPDIWTRLRRGPKSKEGLSFTVLRKVLQDVELD